MDSAEWFSQDLEADASGRESDWLWACPSRRAEARWVGGGRGADCRLTGYRLCCIRASSSTDSSPAALWQPRGQV